MSDSIRVLSETFARACEARPDQVSERVFSVGGGPVYARIAGSDVTRILERSLAPGVADGPGLRLELWDEEATGVALEATLGIDHDLDRGGAGGEQLGFSADGRYVRFAAPTFEIRMDRAQRHAVGWLRSEKLLSSWHRARPLQTLFFPWIATRGATVVHAAMVARAGSGIILAGPALSGKSTSTAACAVAGFQLLGDEAIVLELDEGRVIGHCVHAAVKLRREGIGRHPALEPWTHTCGPPWQDEAVAFLGEAFPDQVAASAEVVALGFPQLVEEPATTFTPLRPGQALRVLTGCLLSVEPGNVPAAFAALADVVDLVPAYRISIGSDTSQLPAGIDDLLRQLRDPVRCEEQPRALRTVHSDEVGLTPRSALRERDPRST